MTTRLAVLLSGGGRTALNLADAIDAGTLDAAIVLAIASRETVGAERLRARGFPVHVVGRATHPEPVARDDAIAALFDDAAVDFVCLCGYLSKLRMDPGLLGRAINIHPSLLPDFGGRGMYGDHVHRAVLAAKCAESGCTVHFVDDVYDRGPVILQRTCPVFADDTVDTLAARVFAEECIAYPEAVGLVASGAVRLEAGRAVRTPA